MHTSLFYMYMHQLWVYVFGIHSCGDNNVTMYCWPETLAKQGSDEVITCLQHFLSQLPTSVTTSLHLFRMDVHVVGRTVCLVTEGNTSSSLRSFLSTQWPWLAKLKLANGKTNECTCRSRALGIVSPRRLCQLMFRSLQALHSLN